MHSVSSLFSFCFFENLEFSQRITDSYMCVSAYALGDPSVTVEQVTPTVSPAGALFPSEVHFSLHIKLFNLFHFTVFHISHM